VAQTAAAPLTEPHVSQIHNYAGHCLGLKSCFRRPGDGPTHPHITASDLIRAAVIGRILRGNSFLRQEWLVHSPARAALQQAKRNKAFENSRFIGLAIDGTGAGRTHKEPCPLCDPVKGPTRELHGSLHHFVRISVVGVGLALPVDGEPYGPGDSEYAAAQRLLRRAAEHLGPRLADYVVRDGAYATAPFLLTALAHRRGSRATGGGAPRREPAPTGRRRARPLRWSTAHDRLPGGRRARRGLGRGRLRPLGNLRLAHCTRAPIPPIQTRWHHRRSRMAGELLRCQTGQPEFLPRAKSRWEIENRGFNDGKNRYGMEHICHHEPISIPIVWLSILLALVIERLFRLRYLRRGDHGVRSAINLLDALWLTLGTRRPPDTS